MSILNHHQKNWVPPIGTNPLKNECGELITIIKEAGLPYYSLWKKIPTNISSQHKRLPSNMDGKPLNHARVLSNRNNKWIIIQIRYDRISSSIGNRMENYPCRHRKKIFLPWLRPIRKYSPPVMDQEYLELWTGVWNLTTYPTYPTWPT